MDFIKIIQNRLIIPKIVAVLLLGTGCSNNNSIVPYTPVNPDAGSSYNISLINNRINSWINNEEIVGAELLIVENKSTVLYNTYGWMDRDNSRAMQSNTIFRLFSNTKPFVSTAVLMLMEQGKLSPSALVSQYLDSFDNDRSREITIEQLLTHTGGFEYQNLGYNDHTDLRGFVDEIGEEGPVYQPGTRYLYSDRGASAAAALVTEISGMPVEDFIQDNIFVPLGMSDTFCNLSLNDTRRQRIASSYALESGQWYKFWDNDNPQVYYYFRGCAGAYSTVLDYVKFLQMWSD